MIFLGRNRPLARQGKSALQQLPWNARNRKDTRSYDQAGCRSAKGVRRRAARYGEREALQARAPSSTMETAELPGVEDLLDPSSVSFSCRTTLETSASL